jgi:ribA/ribD-fused uncharacterized protein
MMAEKARLFEDAETRAKILSTQSPDHMKKLGREVRNFNPRVWDAHCDEIVFNGNMAKFSQNPSMRAELMETGSRTLVEASPFDKIWGIGLAADHANATRPAQWQGANKLGHVLMKVREQLRAYHGNECATSARHRGPGGGEGLSHGSRGVGGSSQGGTKRTREAMAGEGVDSRRATPGGETSSGRALVGSGGGARGTGSSRRGDRIVEGWGVTADDWWAGA